MSKKRPAAPSLCSRCSTTQHPCSYFSGPRAVAPIARTIKPLSSRRTARWSDEWSHYRRFEGLEAAALLAQLYAPATPHQRLVAEGRTPDAVRARVNEIYAGLDPVALLRNIRAVQEQLANLTDAAPASHPTAAPSIEQFLSSLRTAWKHGAGRPTDRPIAKPKRERRRPDPLVKATPRLREWFEAEPWRSSSELLSKLQAECPGVYPSKVLRTLQRRLKLWRSEQATALLFGSGENAAQTNVIVTSPGKLPAAGPRNGGVK